MNRFLASVSAGFLGFSLVANPASAGDSFGLDRIGFRAGPDSDDGVTITGYEAYATAGTPWSWDIAGNTRLSVEFEGAIGGLSGEDDTSAYARVAPQLRLGFDSFPVSGVLGPGVTILSEEKFGDELDLGGHFEFFTSVGLDWRLSEDWTIGYRFLHISNGNLHETNPSLNLQTLGFDYSF
ncbi:MAG: acyloxyacyl hydrolase [Puniceicoccaceae bacterium]